MADGLEVVDQIFAAAGIFVGDVRQIEVTGKILDEGSRSPDLAAGSGFAFLQRRFGLYPELPELFKLSAGASNVALDVFLVDNIEIDGLDGLSGRPVGIAGGTPVPLGMHGTPSSGLVLRTNDLIMDVDAEKLGRVLAHEIGHTLGLFHTTERNGLVFDPLPDTPACPVDNDVNGGGLTASECIGAGAENLMFPSTDATASVLSDDQIDVMSGALILQ